jgi:trehalose 6-phosphate synthase
MARLLRFLAVLVVALGLLAWGSFHVVNSTTQAWFEKDIALRAQLAVNGARWALLSRWDPAQADAIRDVLTEIARDERIMGAAACNSDLSLLAATTEYPSQFSCAGLGPQVRQTPDTLAKDWRTSTLDVQLPGGRVHVSAVPIVYVGKAMGFVALVHDMAFIDRREAKVQQLILIAFGVLAVAASLITVLAGRLFWRWWTQEIRKFLKGGAQRREFRPILRDVRELIERIAADRALDEEGGAWTPARLKQTLTQHLHGEKVVILANREPYIHDRAADGTVRILHPASGLVTAMEPVMRACGGVWVAHGSGSADRETADHDGRIRVPPGEESYILRRVWLSPEEEKGYYYGFANEGLWPLCHMAHTRPVFRREDWEHYKIANRRFAETVCSEVDSDDPIVFVQDYHFALAPRFIREHLPRATIISFWHIPWPNSERLGICPWREELLQGMLGSSILGFHTQLYCNNFVDAVDRFLEARIDREQTAVIHQKRRTLVRAYPISIEWPSHWLKDSPQPSDCRGRVLAELKLSPDTLLGVGVDRLDYTKGIEERLWAVERLLERYPEFRGRFTFVQLAAPSRTAIERYRQLDEAVATTAARINERFSMGEYRPIILLRAHHEPPTVYRYYRAADLCYVSSLHDGMNLVAKEFVAARDDERGVLVLSHFAGASKELTEALIVNPYDLDEASSALATALRMSPEEQQERMHAMRTLLAEYNVYRWAGRMLIDAARLRGKDRLTGRLSDHLTGPTESRR